MNQIYDPPLDYGFGLDFDYDRWSPGSVVKLSTVSWDSQYRDVVKFDGHDQLNAYLDNKTITRTIDKVFHIKPDAPFIKLDVPYNAALKFNYLHVYNPTQPVNGDTPANFYYFITHVEYSAPNTSRIFLQLDVWQTYIYDVQLLSGYLERGHAGVVLGRDYLKAPEPFDTGETYVSDKGTEYSLVQPQNARLLITSATSLVADPGTYSNPKMPTAQGSNVQGNRSGAESWICDVADFQRLMSGLSAKPWIAQGIIDIQLIPVFDIGVDYFPSTQLSDGTWWPPRRSDSGTASCLYAVPAQAGIFFQWNKLGNADELVTTAMKASLPSAWRWVVDRFEKFKTSPFSYIEFKNDSGESNVLMPEYLPDDPWIVANFSIVPGDVRVAFTIENYAPDNGRGNAFMQTNFPRVPTVNNNAAISLASQQRGLQQARQSASWAQQKAMQSAAYGYNNTLEGANAGVEMADNARALDANSTAIGNTHMQNTAITNSILGTVGSGIAGAPAGPGGIAVGVGMGVGQSIGNAINVGANVDAANQQLAARQNASIRASNIGYGATMRIADNNYNLAEYASKGDYANTIAAIDAKVQDTMMTPPSAQGSVGAGGSVLAMYARISITRRVKMLSATAIMRIAEQWSRYGYYVNRFVNIDKLDIMRHYTYWKLQETYIDASGLSLNNTLLLAIRGIFEKGVTVWNDPAKIGSYDFEGNRPL